ncbi:MAG: HEPN domain-containing protein [Nanoarchaeota archaeon]|nr:HEPN domain-containing protein [Nanoarchaeota archaeon]
MEFDKEYYQEEFKRLLSEKRERKFFIKKSNASFKIKKFMIKGMDSFELAEFVNGSDQSAKSYWAITICYYAMLYLAKAAILTKGYETDDHYATQIALGHLLVPDELEKEDLELLNQAHKIFEEDYLEYFHDARKESSVSKYSPTKVYTERRTKEILDKARQFTAKLRLFLEE